MTGQPRAALLARISEHDVNVPKTENQLRDGEKHAATRGYAVVGHYVDDGISASKKFKNGKAVGKERPDWERLLADALSGKFDVIVAVDDDRLCRDVGDKIALHMACADHRIIWDTVRGGIVDPSTADGEFLSIVKTAVSQMESRKKAERQRSANAHRRAQGLPTCQGARPFGFEPDFMTHREDEAEIIREMYDRFLRGAEAGKLYPILKDLNRRGILTARLADWKIKLDTEPEPTDPKALAKREKMREALKLAEKRGAWSYAAITKILARRRNAGIVEHNREIVEGVTAQWEPIVPREDWEDACALLGDPERQIIRQQEPKHLLSGIIFCGTCGAAMSPVTSSHKGKRETYYRCKSKLDAFTDERRHPAIRQAEIDPIARQAVLDSYFIAPNAAQAENAEVESLGKLHKRLSELRQGIADLTDLVGTPGFDKARTIRRAKELADEEAELVGKIETQARQSAHAAMLIEAHRLMNPKTHKASLTNAGKHKAELGKAFDAMGLEQRRTLVAALTKITVHAGRRPVAERVDIEHLAAPSLDLEDAS